MASIQSIKDAAGAPGGASAPAPGDPAQLAQQLKAQLLPADKVLSKNQKKKARKKVTKLVQKVRALVTAFCAGRTGHGQGVRRLDSHGGLQTPPPTPSWITGSLDLMNKPLAPQKDLQL